MVRSGPAFLVCVLGCSGEESPDDGTMDGADDTDSDGPVPPGSDNPYQGLVAVASGVLGPPVRSLTVVPSNTIASAYFYTNEGEVSDCTDRPIGHNCFVHSCTLSQPGTTVLFGAGTIDFGGLTQTIQLLEQPDHSYLQFLDFVSPSYFTPGTDVTVSAGGGDVPAFGATVVAPDQNLPIVDPPAPTAEQEPVPLDTDRRVEWAATSRGKVTVRIVKLDGADYGTMLSCSRLATPLINEVVIPLSQVHEFNSGAAAEQIFYTSDVRVTAGQFSVLFELRSPVVTPAGDPYFDRPLLLQSGS